MTPQAETTPISPVIDAEEAELVQVKREYSETLTEWARIRDDCEKKKRVHLLPLESRMEELRKQMVALGPKPSCFGVRNDLDLPECEGCPHGARCYRTMKAKGLI